MAAIKPDNKAQPPDNLTPVAGPVRRNRSVRKSRRLRIYLAIGALAVGATTLAATPVGDAVRTQTQELLSNVTGGETEEPEVLAEEQAAPVAAPGIVFDDSVFVDPRMVGLQPPWDFDGILTFRGSPTRSFYGRGPVPENPEVQWRFPEEGGGGLCRQSTAVSYTHLTLPTKA